MGVKRDKDRDAVRLVRSAPWAPLDQAARAAGITARGARNKLRSLPARGVCAQAALWLSCSGYSNAATAAALGAVYCPPSAVRVCADDTEDRIVAAAASAASTAAWSARRDSPCVPWQVGVVSPACPPPTMRALAQASGPVARSDVLRSPACPPAALTRAVSLHIANRPRKQSDLQLEAAVDNPVCAAGTVAALTANHHPTVRAAAATHRSCPSVLLSALIEDPDSDTRRAAAANPGCLSRQLVSLTAFIDPLIARHATSNPALGADTLRDMIAARDVSHLAAAARNPICPPDALEQISRHKNPRTRAAAAANANLDAGRVAELVCSDPDAQVRAAALTHPDCPPQAIAAGSVDRSEQVRHVALTRPDCPPDAVGAVVGLRRGYDDLRDAATHPACPPQALSVVAFNDDPLLAAAAASHPACPPETLAAVVAAALDPDAGYITTESGGQSDLIPEAALAALNHPNCPPETLTVAATSPILDMQYAALKHRDCPAGTVDAVIAAADWGATPWNTVLVETALEHPACPPETLAAAAARPIGGWHQEHLATARRRTSVAHNPNCGPQLLAQMCADPDRDVVEAAVSNRACPPKIRAATLATLLR